MMTFIPGKTQVHYAGRVYDELEKMYAHEAVNEFQLTYGRYSKEFETKFSNYLGVSNTILVNSGSSANLAAISALTSKRLKDRQLKPGNEVITLAAGFPTTLAPILQNQLIPVFVDVEIGTYNALPEQIEMAIGPRTKAIFLPHTLGVPFDRNHIEYLAKKHNLFLIGDCCDALGSVVDGDKVGSFEDIGTFSFFPAHHLSCSKYTQIPYLDKDNNYNIDTIEDIYKNYCECVSDIKVLAFNKLNNIEWKSPSAVIRHVLGKKKLFRLTSKHGRFVEVTEDHSVFVLNKEKTEIEAKRVIDIQKGEYVVSSSSLPHPPKQITYVDIVEPLRKYRTNVENFNESNLYNVENSKKRAQIKKENSLPIRYLTKYDLSTENIKLAVAQSKQKLPGRIYITEGLCRLIGYFIAEGSYCTGGLCLSFCKDETNTIEDIQFILKKEFDINPHVYPASIGKGVNIKINSSTLSIVFRDILGIVGGAKNKRIPKIIFHLSKECIGAFVYGYTVGDGSIRKLKDNTNSIDVTSASKNLISDLQYLISMLGIGGCFYRRNIGGKSKIICGRRSNSSPNYTLRMSGLTYKNKNIINTNKKERNATINSIPLTNGIREIISTSKNQKVVSKRRILNTIGSDKSKEWMLFGDLSFLEVRSIEEVEYNEQEYVYDFSVPECENFYGGFMGIFMHNTMGQGGAVVTKNPDLAKIIRSFVQWGRDCSCPPGSSNICGKRFSGEYDHKYVYSEVGYNLEITDIQAAIGCAQLTKLENFIDRRKENHAYLMENLNFMSNWLIFQHKPENTDPSWFCFVITVKDNAPFTRNELTYFLEQHKIETRPLFGGNLLEQPAFKGIKCEKPFRLKNTDKVMDSTFFIGVYPGIGMEERQWIVEVFKKFKELKCSQY